MPVRTCVGCRKAADKKDLVRLVKAPEGAIVDAKGILPGRGVYVCPDAECLETALNKNAIARGLKVKKVETIVGFAERLKKI